MLPDGTIRKRLSFQEALWLVSEWTRLPPSELQPLKLAVRSNKLAKYRGNFFGRDLGCKSLVCVGRGVPSAQLVGSTHLAQRSR